MPTTCYVRLSERSTPVGTGRYNTKVRSFRRCVIVAASAAVAVLPRLLAACPIRPGRSSTVLGLPSPLEFRVFVEAAERQLLLLFRSIDKDRNGRLDRQELQTAFQRSGITVPKRRLNAFFDEIDVNHDGFIGFDEWR